MFILVFGVSHNMENVKGNIVLEISTCVQNSRDPAVNKYILNILVRICCGLDVCSPPRGFSIFKTDSENTVVGFCLHFG